MNASFFLTVIIEERRREEEKRRKERGRNGKRGKEKRLTNHANFMYQI